MMKECLIKNMREKGLKLTLQRLAIIDVLVKKNLLHPSGGVIYDAARRRTKGLSLSTVYFSLNEFSKQGIIKALEFDKMENRYEGNLTDHINLTCKECKTITDYRGPGCHRLKGSNQKNQVLGNRYPAGVLRVLSEVQEETLSSLD